MVWSFIKWAVTTTGLAVTLIGILGYADYILTGGYVAPTDLGDWVRLLIFTIGGIALPARYRTGIFLSEWRQLQGKGEGIRDPLGVPLAILSVILVAWTISLFV